MIRSSSFARAVGFGALLLVNVPSPSLAQTLTITGRVVEASSLRPIANATVTVQGDPPTVALTDDSGRYSLAIPRPDVTLVFAAPGFIQQEIGVEGRTVVNVPLMRGPILLGELGVTSRSQQERPTISGRIDSLDGSTLAGVQPCTGAALVGPQALEPHAPPLRMPEADEPSAPIPNACAVPTPGSAGAR